VRQPCQNRGRRILPTALRATVLAAGLMLAIPAAAEAKPVQPADVDQAFHKAEAVNEEVNMIGSRIDATRQEIDDLGTDIKRQNQLYRQQKEELGAIIVQQHMDAPLGPTVNLLGSNDPTAFLEGLGAVEAMNSTQAAQLEKFAETSQQLKARQGQLKQREAALESDQANIDGKRAEVKKHYKKAKALFSQLSTAEQAKFMDSDTDLNFEIDAVGKTKQAIDFAVAQLGDAYVYGGTGPNGWDCSGLVMKSFAAAGVSLPRVVGPQMSAVRSVSMDGLQPGDLVAYGDMSHIGIYLGSGKVIHAPHPGRSVEITGLSRYTRAGRVG
jgi:cell wall-associated NlpC family hydrolase